MHQVYILYHWSSWANVQTDLFLVSISDLYIRHCQYIYHVNENFFRDSICQRQGAALRQHYNWKITFSLTFLQDIEQIIGALSGWFFSRSYHPSNDPFTHKPAHTSTSPSILPSVCPSVHKPLSYIRHTRTHAHTHTHTYPSTFYLSIVTGSLNFEHQARDCEFWNFE